MSLPAELKAVSGKNAVALGTPDDTAGKNEVPTPADSAPTASFCLTKCSKGKLFTREVSAAPTSKSDDPSDNSDQLKEYARNHSRDVAA